MQRNETDARRRKIGAIPYRVNGTLTAGQTFQTSLGEVFVSIDGAAPVAAANDVIEVGFPTLGSGFGRGLYYYPASQSETNCANLEVFLVKAGVCGGQFQTEIGRAPALSAGETDATKRKIAGLAPWDVNGAPLTGQTFATASGQVLVSLDGAAFAAAAADATEIGYGLYAYPASLSETLCYSFLVVVLTNGSVLEDASYSKQIGGASGLTLTATLADATLASALTTGASGFTLTTTLAAATLAASLGVGDDTYTIDGTWATATNAMHVELGFEPKHSSEFDDGDALNPASWSVTVPSTGQAYTVIGVAMDTSTSYDLIVLEALGDHFTSHRVTATLDLISGGPVPPISSDFAGTVETLDPIQAVSLDRFLDRDLQNPTAQSSTGGGSAGTLQIGDSGDYLNESGVDLVRKLVLRRLMTPRDGFPHLPGYGVGLALKEPIQGSGNLVALRTQIETQIQLEPDVESASVGLQLDNANVLFVELRIAVAGRGSTFTMQMQAANGQLVEL